MKMNEQDIEFAQSVNNLECFWKEFKAEFSMVYNMYTKSIQACCEESSDTRARKKFIHMFDDVDEAVNDLQDCMNSYITNSFIQKVRTEDMKQMEDIVREVSRLYYSKSSLRWVAVPVLYRVRRSTYGLETLLEDVLTTPDFKKAYSCMMELEHLGYKVTIDMNTTSGNIADKNSWITVYGVQGAEQH